MTDMAASVVTFMTTVPGVLLGAVERNPLAAVVFAPGMAGVAVAAIVSTRKAVR